MFLTTDDGRRPTPLPRKNCNHLAPNWVTFDAVCDDGRRPTALQRRATGDGRRTTDDGRRTTDDGRRTTARGTPATDDGRRLRPTTTTTTATTTTSPTGATAEAPTPPRRRGQRASFQAFAGRCWWPQNRAHIPGAKTDTPREDVRSRLLWACPLFGSDSGPPKGTIFI